MLIISIIYNDNIIDFFLAWLVNLTGVWLKLFLQPMWLPRGRMLSQPKDEQEAEAERQEAEAERSWYVHTYA